MTPPAAQADKPMPASDISPDIAEPRQEYQRRLDARMQAVARLDRADNWYANARLTSVFAAIVIGIVSAFQASVGWYWVIPPILLFVVLAVRHDGLLRTLKRSRRAAAFYESGIARLDDRWAGRGVSGVDLIPAGHPYAADMDLFGEGSLFELLCTARTKAGEESLAAWLCAPATLAEIHARQAAVEELRTNIDMREDLAVAADDVRAQVLPESLIQWATAPTRVAGTKVEWIARGLTAAIVVTSLGWLVAGMSYSPFLLCIAAVLIALRVWKKDLEAIIARVQEPSKELNVLGAVLARFEELPFQSPKLVELQRALHNEHRRASVAISRLERMIQWLDAERNMLFAPFAIAVLWRVHFAIALERWRGNHGAHVGAWLRSLGELEALSALAGFAYERPEFAVPDVHDGAPDGGPEFAADALGHPLLPAPERVTNTLQFGQSPRALIVSGSNMSGKSTLLRTVGINASLALAGAPVCARSLRLSRCNIGATIRIEDSIQRGASRFYAEITRIKQIFDLSSRELPVLFLLDELFGGTNSHDRGVGAAALMKGLLDAGAFGLVTTHDLALTRFSAELGDAVRNVHFEDTLEGDRLVFDYTLKDGVVQKSNALDLMRAVGLKV